jgi:hypothetical protein
MSRRPDASNAGLFPVTPFCIPGQHPYAGGPTGNLLEGAALPEGWVRIPATFDNVRKKWFRNPGSTARIWSCPDHAHLVETIE